ncbi:MAG: DUF4383 domain-containing protein [Mycobacteriales bacterium]
MSHLPANHTLRGLYRTTAFLCAAALMGYGVIGYLRTSDREFFARESERVLGLTTNPAFAVLCFAAGLIVLLGVLIGRNVDVRVDIALGSVLLVVATVMLALLRTDSNVLAFSITNVNVYYVIGLVLITAGLYSSTTPGVRTPSVSRN